MNQKTLAVILHYNTKEFTDRLYRQLQPYEGTLYDLVILDNGSEIKPDNAHYSLPQNIYFGGALNLAFKWILDNSHYDSLLFLNNDLIIHGKDFVSELRKGLVDDYKIISPSIIQPEETQCYWPTMNNWHQDGVRQVPWVDFQCPLIHRNLIEQIKKFDDLLIRGWGNDTYAGYVCEKNNWKIGVIDKVMAVHLGGATIKATNASDYTHLAEKSMYAFFESANLNEDFFRLRDLAKNYSV